MFARVDSRRCVRFDDYDEYEAVYTRQAKMLVSGIIEDLEKEGYEVQTFNIPAAGVGAPHRRERVWFVAYRNDSKTYDNLRINGQGEKKNKRWKEQPFPKYWKDGFNGDVTNAQSESGRWELFQRQEERKPGRQNIGVNVKETPTESNGFRQSREEHGQEKTGLDTQEDKRLGWKNFPTQPPVCGRDDGFSDRLDGITFPSWRNESIKGFGNAVVPDIPYEIFKAIQDRFNGLL